MTTRPQSSHVPQLNPDEEDALIHARITNDERPLRRLTRKFHIYSSIAFPQIMGDPISAMTSLEEAREAFLIELASFRLLLRKSGMVCDAERRQVSVYKQESQRIANERVVLTNEIEELKLALEQAQLERRRKIEYDQVAEKINALPTREELELSISALENDIQVIRDEHETLNRSVLTRKVALDAIVNDIGNLVALSKDSPKDAMVSRAPSEPLEAEAEPVAPGSGMDIDIPEGTNAAEAGEREDGEESRKRRSMLHPSAKPFSPSPSNPLLPVATQNSHMQRTASGLSLSGLTPFVSREVTPMLTPVAGPDSSPLSPVDAPSPMAKREEGEEEEEGEEGEETEDIEMGEVSEGKGGPKGKKDMDDREEGEASDESSVLSDPPDE